MSKHTPGPWIYNVDTFQVEQDKEPFYKLLATVHGSKNEKNANARLIAAAPEMLDLLKRLSQEIMQLCHTSKNADPRHVAMIEEAVAKAEGKQ